jgi:hypothetical protein
MAEISLGARSDSAGWIEVSGDLDGPDSAVLLDTARSADGDPVTIDARHTRALSAEGCEALRYVGDQLADQGRRVRIVYRPGSTVAEALADSGTLQHPSLEFADGGSA